jgi:hypothetical protein
MQLTKRATLEPRFAADLERSLDTEETGHPQCRPTDQIVSDCLRGIAGIAAPRC